MTKHTKGPWSIGLETDELEAQIINVEGMHIATVECDPVMDNARLIAEAPAMLETLEQAYDNLSWHPDDTKAQLIGYIKDVQEQIEQAIRKAKGE